MSLSLLSAAELCDRWRCDSKGSLSLSWWWQAGRQAGWLVGRLDGGPCPCPSVPVNPYRLVLQDRCRTAHTPPFSWRGAGRTGPWWSGGRIPQGREGGQSAVESVGGVQQQQQQQQGCARSRCCRAKVCAQRTCVSFRQATRRASVCVLNTYAHTRARASRVRATGRQYTVQSVQTTRPGRALIGTAPSHSPRSASRRRHCSNARLGEHTHSHSWLPRSSPCRHRPPKAPVQSITRGGRAACTRSHARAANNPTPPPPASDPFSRLCRCLYRVA